MVQHSTQEVNISTVSLTAAKWGPQQEPPMHGIPIHTNQIVLLLTSTSKPTAENIWQLSVRLGVVW
jgi:hypothetical protein